MVGRWHRRRRARFRAVSPILATVLLIGITLAAGVILWSFRVQTPVPGIHVEYIAEGDQSEPAWGDPTDCTNQTIYAHCDNLPAFFLIFTSHTPSAIPLVDLNFRMVCNGTNLVNGSFAQMEVVPGSGSNPVNSSPTLGKCNTWKPSTNGAQSTFFNRLAYFQQIDAPSTVLHDGDIFVVYEHPLTTWCDRSNRCPDDDYHGAPPWCFTSFNACTIDITFTGYPTTLIASIPLLDIGTVGA